MKRLSPIVLLFCCALLFYSCHHNNQEKENEALALTPPQDEVTESPMEYGFNLDHYQVISDTIRSGDTFGKIMGEQGVSSNRIFQIIHKVKDTFDARKLVTGKPYTILKQKSSPDEVAAFIYQRNKIDYTVIDLMDSIEAYDGKHPITVKHRSISGEINSSLSHSMMEAGASAALIHKLANLYQWKIDFFRLQKGDKFKIIYDVNYIKDSIYAGISHIDAAEFVHYDKPYYAFHFGEDEDNGSPKFYDEKAKTLQNFFLKAPVKYTRISSRYTKRRYHPVQHRWKAHLGTDYAAPTGTPIHTTADGVVIASRHTRFNGNYVKVRHNSKYTTQYLHMSKRNVRTGQHVSQGDVIGFVGQTGLATGPHVCYRFWVNGKQVDPYKQKMPSSEPLADSLKPEYFESIASLKKQLDHMSIKVDPSDKPTDYGDLSLSNILH